MSKRTDWFNGFVQAEAISPSVESEPHSTIFSDFHSKPNFPHNDDSLPSVIPYGTVLKLNRRVLVDTSESSNNKDSTHKKSASQKPSINISGNLIIGPDGAIVSESIEQYHLDELEEEEMEKEKGSSPPFTINVLSGGVLHLCGGEIDIIGHVRVKSGGTLVLTLGSLGARSVLAEFEVAPGRLIVRQGGTLITGGTCGSLFPSTAAAEGIGKDAPKDSYSINKGVFPSSALIAKKASIYGLWKHESSVIPLVITSLVLLQRPSHWIYAGPAPISGKPEGRIINRGTVTVPPGSKVLLGVALFNEGIFSLEHSCFTSTAVFSQSTPKAVFYLAGGSASFYGEDPIIFFNGGRIQIEPLPAKPSFIAAGGETVVYFYIPLVGNVRVTSSCQSHIFQAHLFDIAGPVKVLSDSRLHSLHGSIHGAGSEILVQGSSEFNVVGCIDRSISKPIRVNAVMNALSEATTNLLETSSLLVMKDGLLDMDDGAVLSSTGGGLWNFGKVVIAPDAAILAPVVDQGITVGNPAFGK